MKSICVSIYFHFFWISTCECNGWDEWYRVYLIFNETHQVAALFHIPTSSVWEFHMLHIFVNTWYYDFNFRHFYNGVVASYVVLPDIFLMTCDVVSLFKCLFAVCISSLVKCHLKSLANLKSWFLMFLLNFANSSYSLYRSPLFVL